MDVSTVVKHIEWEQYYDLGFDWDKWADIEFYVSNKELLSEDFIREFRDKVSWTLVSMYCELSEDFIREFKDYVDWDVLLLKRVLSPVFINEFDELLKNKCLPSVYATHVQVR